MAMAKPYTHSWTPEKLAAKDRKAVEAIRKNAARLGANDLIEMCDNDLKARAPHKEKRAFSTQARHSEGDVVTGYHFVCQRDRGVTPAGENRFWSGSWVVAEINVRASIQFGAYLALHETKSNVSYRQGQILDYRRSPRDMLSQTEEVGKTEEGIEFLVQETSEPYAWVGAGAGEKGYRWSRIVAAPTPEPVNSSGSS
jgi:hypothetical protein